MSDLAPLAILSKGFFDEVISRQQQEIHALKQEVSRQQSEIEQLTPRENWVVGATVRFASEEGNRWIIRQISETQMDLEMRPVQLYATVVIQKETGLNVFEGEIREWGNVYNLFKLVP
jgi:hypothetical protein